MRNVVFLGILALLLIPEIAVAANSITELEGPFEQVVGTLTGPVGKGISIAGMALCGITFIIKRDNIEGGFKMLLGIVFAISFIAFASSMVDTIFSSGFTGALLR
jgi:type IV secretion system protein VirB2